MPGGIQLVWETKEKSNISFFDIQYSPDGVSYASIHSTVAKNSFSGSRYEYLHTASNKGLQYYRLVVQERTGEKNFSNIVAVVWDSNEEVSLVPVPARDFVEAHLVDCGYQLAVVVSATGQVLQGQKLGQNQTLTKIPLQKMAKGTYYLCLSGNGGSTVHPFIKE